jgi:hypothetical protein
MFFIYCRPVVLSRSLNVCEKDACAPGTAEPGIARLELDDSRMSATLGPFAPGVFGHGLEENSRQYFRRTSAW